MHWPMVSFASFTRPFAGICVGIGVSVCAAAALGGCSHENASSEASGASSQSLGTADADTTTRPPHLDAETRAKLHAQMLEHARCMREHGVDLPDPPEPKEGAPAFFTLRKPDAVPALPIADGDVPIADGNVPSAPMGMPGAPVIFRNSDDAGVRILLRLPTAKLPDGGTSPEAAAFEACASKLPGSLSLTKAVEAP